MRRHPRLFMVALSACLVALLAAFVGEATPQTTTKDDRLRAERLADKMDLPLSVSTQDHPVDGIRAAFDSSDADPTNITSRMTFFIGEERPTTLTEAVVDLTVNHRTSQISHDVYGDLIYSNFCTITNETVTSRVVARRADEGPGRGWDVGIEGVDELGREQCHTLYQVGALTSEEVLAGF